MLKKIATPEIKVQKGVPLPTRHYGNKGRTRIYPFPEMEVGDSFFVPAAPGQDPRHAQQSIYGSISGWRMRHAPEQRFTTQVDDNGVWVWRIA